MRRTLITVAIAALLLTTGCTEEDGMDLQQRAEARAAEARVHVDDLANRVGETREVLMDELTDCVPGQEDSGIDLVYKLRVQTEGDPEQLLDDVSGQMAGEGWEITRDPAGDGTVSARFGKDGFSMSTRVSTSSGLATISGSGGCVQ
jgi:hypothetical protein